jgi:hypothetical protein
VASRGTKRHASRPAAGHFGALASRGVEIEAVGARTPPPRAPEPMGISADLAEARKQLREATPPDRWNAVMDEVRNLQNTQHMSLLSALREVYAKIASGWSPPAR